MGNFFQNSLERWWQWGILLAIPPAIVLLYFLKLKRRPLEVPSTYLWHKAVEDLHVNSIWQRLRQNILLLLQLLLVALVMFALLRPGKVGLSGSEKEVLILLDTSASMSAVENGKSRLDLAKSQAEAVIDALRGDQRAMLISFSDNAKIEQAFTDNRRLLRAKLAAIRPTQRTSNLDEALRAAAALANPGRTGEAGKDAVAAQGFRADLFIFSDGGFRKTPQFSLGNLSPQYVKIGSPVTNLAITAFSTDRNPERPDRMQAFARIENYGAEAVTCEATLSLDGTLIDAQKTEIPARSQFEPGAGGLQFDLEDLGEGILKLEISTSDALVLDNTAYAVLNPPRPARVLVVTPGNAGALRTALSTDEAKKIAEVEFVGVGHLESKQFEADADSGIFDLMIFDRCSPKKAPQCNTLFLGRVPTYAPWEPGEKQGAPVILDIDRVHPLTQLLDMSAVLITDSIALKTPSGASKLFDADIGTIYAVAPRQSYEDAVLGFELTTADKVGNDIPATTWHLRRSFPVFVMNAVKYLGGNRGQTPAGGVNPGEVYPIRTQLPVPKVKVKTPAGKDLEVLREGLNAIAFTQTDDLGVYEVREGTAVQPSQRFAVNLFDPRESDLTPAETLPIGAEEIAANGASGTRPARSEWWRTLLFLALGVLLFEWYVFNQRVYL